MMEWVASKIPEDQLTAWFGWFTFLAIFLPVLGGFAGWAAWRVGDRISEVKDGKSEERARGVQSDLSSAKSQLTNVHGDLATARSDLTNAKAKIEELSKARLPRTISTDQEALFVATLKPFAKMGSIRIDVMDNDSEALALAFRFKGIFEVAGFSVDFRRALAAFDTLDGKSSGIPTGVIFQFKDPEHKPPHAFALFNLLNKIGFTIPAADLNPHLDEKTVRLMVGTKPP
jgi:hypothetical protein